MPPGTSSLVPSPASKCCYITLYGSTNAPVDTFSSNILLTCTLCILVSQRFLHRTLHTLGNHSRRLQSFPPLQPVLVFRRAVASQMAQLTTFETVSTSRLRFGFRAFVTRSPCPLRVRWLLELELLLLSIFIIILFRRWLIPRRYSSGPL